VSLLVVGLAYEARTSRLQALILARLATHLTSEVGAGPSASVVYPGGPADQRLGYADLAAYARRLKTRGFAVARQARFSPALLTYAGLGLNPPYAEKHVAGLSLFDRHGNVLFDGTNRRHEFTSFDDIPPPIVPALLFIENRELFADEFPYRNPAVEWDRLAHVLYVRGAKSDFRDRYAAARSRRRSRSTATRRPA
jgi:membrane peptidoglycan carboxypeptidase